MTDFYSKPLTAQDEQKTKTFYNLLCLCGMLIVLLPAGVANIILGYMMGDSPCTMCWGQRIEMIFIGVTALFMVRYGIKARYLATMFIMAAAGLYMSFRHFGNHAARDIGQGFGLDILGIHTQFWAEIVFWCAVFIFGLVLFLAPRFDAFVAEMKGKQFRPMTGFMKACFWIVFAISASNTFQALWSTGLPPNWGQGSPVRFSMNPEYVKWSDASWHGMWSGINFLGKRDVKDPDFAYHDNTKKLGLTFDHKAANGPLEVQGQFVKKGEQKLDIALPVNTFAKIGDGYVAASKYNFWKLDNNFKVIAEGEMDPWFDANVLDIVGITPFKEDAFVFMGMNKSILRLRYNENADRIDGWANFVKGGDKFEKVGGLGRARIDTERAKFSYVHSSATDGKYIFTATVPDNKNKTKLVISKALMKDWTLSAEFMPESKLLKKDRTLGELYITGMEFNNGMLVAVSKNFNTLMLINPAAEAVEVALALPEDLTDIRGVHVLENGDVQVIDHNRVVTLGIAK